ncbi:MAG TPA: copper chaperone PCu(A)C [Pseudonocardiaceae bacterium]
MSSARLRPLAILLGTLLLAGCGTGQETQTSTQQSAVDGAQGQVGPIAVRNARLAYPEGGAHRYQRGDDAPMLAVIVNTGTTEDELTSVSSPVAEVVQIEGQRKLPAQRTLRAVAPSSNATQAGQGLTAGQVRIVLVNLAEDVGPGRTVRVTFLFRQAGELSMEVPIGPPAETGAASGS